MPSWYEVAPPGYSRLEADQPCRARHLALAPPAGVHQLADWGDDPDGPGVLSPLAISEPFRLLSDEGVAVLAAIADELRPQAQSNRRAASYYRGALYRSLFLQGLYADPTVIDLLRGIAGATIEPHPVTHHALQLNFAPADTALDVDRWHTDMVSFDVVVLVSDPRSMEGGRFEYFLGAPEEGRALIARGGGLPPERVATPAWPGPGWAVLQQGHRVLHRAGALDRPFPRVTAVASYYTPHPTIPDPTELNNPLRTEDGEVALGDFDGPEIALVEYARFAALVTAGRLEDLALSGTGFDGGLANLLADIEGRLRPLERAREALGSHLSP